MAKYKAVEEAGKLADKQLAVLKEAVARRESRARETALKPCPFCGSAPEEDYRSNAYGTGASGMEAPDLLLRCSNESCPVRPETPGEATERYESGKGYFDQADKVRADQVRRWNSRISD